MNLSLAGITSHLLNSPEMAVILRRNVLASFWIS